MRAFPILAAIASMLAAAPPKDITDKIAAEVRAVLAQDEFKRKFSDLGAIPAPGTPADFAKLIDDDRKRYAQIIQDRKVTVE